MKKFNSIFLISSLLTLALFSCKTSEEVTTASTSDTPKEEVPKDQSELVTEEPASETKADTTQRAFFASIERTPCFGKCPTYNMTIYSDGFVEYHGTRDVEMIGDYTTRISEKKLEQFRKKAREIGYMELDDKYDGMITDVPSTTTAIILDGKKKEVYRRYNYPTRILAFEKLFDELLTSERWVSSKGEVYPPEE